MGRCYEADEGPPQSPLTLLRPDVAIEGDNQMDQTTSTLSANTLHCALELSKNSWAFGDPVSRSGAAEPLSNRRRKHRQADGEARCSPGLLGQGSRCAASDHALLRGRL